MKFQEGNRKKLQDKKKMGLYVETETIGSSQEEIKNSCAELIKQFNRKVKRDGLMQTLKLKEHYIKPSEARKLARKYNKSTQEVA